jgi:hypothetical protein
MDVIDKFIKRYSYKFPKGYPVFPQDNHILKEILSSLDLDLEPISESHEKETCGCDKTL